MDFFGIGFGEIVLILIVALIIFGPGKLPEIARSIGRFSRNLRRMSSDFTTAVTKELDLEEEQKNLKKMSSDLKTDVASGLSLGEEPSGHLDANKTQPQISLPPASPAESNNPAALPALPPVDKHE